MCSAGLFRLRSRSSSCELRRTRRSAKSAKAGSPANAALKGPRYAVRYAILRPMTYPIHEIDDLLREDRTFPPPPDFCAQAIVRDDSLYAEADRDPEAFWARFAAELEWSRPWDRILDWQPPHAKWFVGGTINASVNCLDRHVRGPRRNKAALIWEGEPGDRRTLTYFELYRQVSTFANVLKSLGVRKGDRVAIYLPLIPELAIQPTVSVFRPRRNQSRNIRCTALVKHVQQIVMECEANRTDPSRTDDVNDFQFVFYL